MAITVGNASLLYKDGNGNVGQVKSLTDNDVAKIKSAITSVETLATKVASVVTDDGQPKAATTTAAGAVTLATEDDIKAGTAGKVVTADQLSSITPADNVVTTDTEQTITAKKTFSSGIDAATVTAGSGANIKLTDETASTDAGKFDITATNGTDTATLEGTADGKLTWNGKPFITEINGQSASSSGSIHIDVSHLGHESTIGVAGEQGFGVGFCDATQTELDKINMRAVEGTYDPGSENYGTYQHLYGGEFKFIPAFYLRYASSDSSVYTTYGRNSVDIVPLSTFANEDQAKANGYVLPRAFIDGGKVQPGFFIQKYEAVNTTLGSKTYPTTNQASYGTVSRAHYSFVSDAQSLGEGFSVASCFMQSVICAIYLAHVQHCKWNTYAAWYTNTSSGNVPKGYANWTDPTAFQKYTHNGQRNGIAMCSTCRWEFGLGITTAGTSSTQGQTQIKSNTIYLLKKEKRLCDLTNGFGGSTDAWGTTSSLTNMYDSYVPAFNLLTSRTVCPGNGEYQVWTNPADSDEDNACFTLFPKGETSISSSGINMLGGTNNNMWMNPVTQNLALFSFGASQYDAGTSNMFSRLWNKWRTHSVDSISFRCAGYLL